MRIEILDHGYVEFVEAWGHGKGGDAKRNFGFDDNECGIIEAARQSTQGSFRGWEPEPCDCSASTLDLEKADHDHDCAYRKNTGDKRLLSYLFRNHHDTPFEFAGMVIEVQAPIFVFREWQRHRTQSYNEMSARYEPLPDLYYVPDLDNVELRAGTSSANKQSQGTLNTKADRVTCSEWIQNLQSAYAQSERNYQQALRENIPKELARLIMPVGHYSRMRASTNLRNWLAFLTLRMDPKAQWEIRQYANAVSQIIAEKFPRTWRLFNEQANAQLQA